jgi:arabinan endo-1,5-alpha-L-arabinosidase
MHLSADVLHRDRIGRRAFVAGTACTLAGLSARSDAQASSINERMHGDFAPVHDPCIIKHSDAFYVFSTTSRPDQGGFVACRRSHDLINWEHLGFTFAQIPEWARTNVPRARGIWAPDISLFNDRFHLYYSVSSFGSNHSAIGLATNETLDPAAPNFEWIDRGLVLQSRQNDDYNAIDPNLFIDRQGGHWLSFGSFWSGIKVTRIDPSTGKPMKGQRIESLAWRPVAQGEPSAIEAPFIALRGDFNYLFVSFDRCCRGVNSDYFVVCGRSKNALGPYVDASGRALMEGGGTVVIRGNVRFKGTGHSAYVRDSERDYLIYHAYDAEREGAPTLRISQIDWTADGWPQAQL